MQCLDFSAVFQKPAPELTSLALYINAVVSTCIFQGMEKAEQWWISLGLGCFRFFSFPQNEST